MDRRCPAQLRLNQAAAEEAQRWSSISRTNGFLFTGFVGCSGSTDVSDPTPLPSFHQKIFLFCSFQLDQEFFVAIQSTIDYIFQWPLCIPQKNLPTVSSHLWIQQQIRPFHALIHKLSTDTLFHTFIHPIFFPPSSAALLSPFVPRALTTTGHTCYSNSPSVSAHVLKPEGFFFTSLAGTLARLPDVRMRTDNHGDH